MRTTSLLCCLTMLGILSPSVARADLAQMPIPTVEWLADNSDVIFIVRVEEDSRLTEGKIIRTLKGDPKSLKHPLEFPSQHNNEYLSRAINGVIRMRFVRGESEMLHEIDLVRPYVSDYYPDLDRIVFGVGQYGDFILSQSQLMDRTVARLAAGPGKLLPVRKKWHWAWKSSEAGSGEEFPLESHGIMYTLIVPFAEERRDYYLTRLQQGNAAEMQYAVYQLSYFEDEQAEAAIRAVLQQQKAPPAYRYNKQGEHIVTIKDVHQAAREVIKRIEE